MKLTWSRLARRDLYELISYIAKDSVQGSALVAARILNTAELLVRVPRGGRPGRVPGTRERAVSRTPYLLVYKIASGGVRILRVYHGARKWPEYF